MEKEGERDTGLIFGCVSINKRSMYTIATVSVCTCSTYMYILWCVCVGT